MLILITYDVNTESYGGQKRLTKVAKCCERYGKRVQNSVFECLLDSTQYKQLKIEILSIIDNKKDSIRFYNLGKNYISKIEHYGAKEVAEPEDVLII